VATVRRASASIQDFSVMTVLFPIPKVELVYAFRAEAVEKTADLLQAGIENPIRPADHGHRQGAGPPRPRSIHFRMRAG
jgi:hypothetical protein